MLTPVRHLSNDSCGPTKCSSLNGVSSVGQLRTCPGEEINWLETSFGHVVPSSPKPCIRRKLSFIHRTLRRCEAHMQQPCLNAQPQLNIFAHVWIPLSLRGLKHWSIWLERDCFKRALTCFADQNVLMLNLTWQKNGCSWTASKQAPAIFCSQPPIRHQHNGTLIGPYRGCCNTNENNFLLMNNR